MPTTTNITTTYSGEFASKYIAAALLSANSLESGAVTVKPNVKYKEVLKRLDTDSLVADGTCDFTPTSTITLTERTIQPLEYQVNLSLCKQDFRSDFEAISMGYSAHDQLPKTFADFLIAHVAAKVAQKTEQTIWSGVAANAGEFDGFETLLSTDANLPAAQEVTGTTVTAANVVAELGKIVDAVPNRLYTEEGLKLFVSQNIYRAYVRSLGGFGASGLGANGYRGEGNNQALNDVVFDGIPLAVCNGMSDNVALCTTSDNLYFATGLMADHNDVRVLDMAEVDLSQNVRLSMRYTAAVQYAISEDIVTYGIVNAAN